MEDEIAFMFELDLPKSLLENGKYIIQFVTLTPSSGEKTTITCALQLGNSWSTQAFEWKGTNDMGFYTNGNVVFE